MAKNFDREIVDGLTNPFSVVNRIKNAFCEYGVNTIKNRYGEEIFIDNGIKQVNEWIKKYDKKYDERSKTEKDDFLTDNMFMINLPSPNTFALVVVGSKLIDKYSKETNHENMYIYVFGRHYKKYISELKDIITKKAENSLYIYDIKGESRSDGKDGIYSVGRTMTRRDIDTLYYNPGVKEDILKHIDNFNENKEIYESKNITYKTGILLYGEPGTGKTSMATALANKYNRDLIVLDLSTFDQLDIGVLTSAINADIDKFIILLEDIDTMFPSLNREDEMDEKTRKVINKMLQFLDSSSSPNDVIFIATTNHYEKLDKAILRDGRFDFKIELSYIYETEAVKMIESFGIDKDGVKKILEKMEESPNTRLDEGHYYMMNPSELQNAILAYFKEINKMEVSE